MCLPVSMCMYHDTCADRKTLPSSPCLPRSSMQGLSVVCYCTVIQGSWSASFHLTVGVMRFRQLPPHTVHGLERSELR